MQIARRLVATWTMPPLVTHPHTQSLTRHRTSTASPLRRHSNPPPHHTTLPLHTNLLSHATLLPHSARQPHRQQSVTSAAALLQLCRQLLSARQLPSARQPALASPWRGLTGWQAHQRAVHVSVMRMQTCMPKTCMLAAYAPERPLLPMLRFVPNAQTGSISVASSYCSRGDMPDN